MTFQLLPLISLLRNFHSNEEQVGWLYSQAMVRFYTLWELGVNVPRAARHFSL